MVPETLDRVPQYPGSDVTKASGEAFLLWRLQLRASVGIAMQSMSAKEYIRQSIIADHGEMRVMGKGPNGRIEYLGDLFERIYGSPVIPKGKSRA